MISIPSRFLYLTRSMRKEWKKIFMSISWENEIIESHIFSDFSMRSSAKKNEQKKFEACNKCTGSDTKITNKKNNVFVENWICFLFSHAVRDIKMKCQKIVTLNLIRVNVYVCLSENVMRWPRVREIRKIIFIKCSWSFPLIRIEEKGKKISLSMNKFIACTEWKRNITLKAKIFYS